MFSLLCNSQKDEVIYTFKKQIYFTGFFSISTCKKCEMNNNVICL